MVPLIVTNHPHGAYNSYKSPTWSLYLDKFAIPYIYLTVNVVRWIFVIYIYYYKRQAISCIRLFILSYCQANCSRLSCKPRLILLRVMIETLSAQLNELLFNIGYQVLHLLSKTLKLFGFILIF